MAQWQPSIFTPDKAADQRRTAASLSAKTISQSLNRTELFYPVCICLYVDSSTFPDCMKTIFWIMDWIFIPQRSCCFQEPSSLYSTTEHPNSLTARYLSSAILSRMIILKITWRYVRLCSTSTMVITKLSWKNARHYMTTHYLWIPFDNTYLPATLGNALWKSPLKNASAIMSLKIF